MPDPAFWQAERETLFELLFPYAEQATHDGVFAGWDMLQVDTDVNWSLVNQQARAWAEQYTYSLVKGITDTTAAFFQSEFAEWIAAGDPLSVLIDSLTPMFGEVRAEMIGVTEVTRIFAEGNTIAWRASGVVDGVQWMTAEDDLVCEICEPLGSEGPVALDDVKAADHGKPPAHVRCRCWLQPVVNVAKWLAVWTRRHEQGAALPAWIKGAA